MAMVKATLQTALIAVFNSMGSSGNNTVFSNGISNAVVDLVSSGDVSTNDYGIIPTGTFTGDGKGKLTVTATACAKIIKDACDLMVDEEHGNDFLAEQIGAGIQKMADDGTVSTTVSGECVTPQGSTISDYTGVATGSISCDSSDLISDLKDIFKQMYDNKDSPSYDGNLRLAEAMADSIYDFWANGTVSTSGEGNLEGSSGTGSIS